MGFLDEFKSAFKNEAADIQKMMKNNPKPAAESDNAEKDELKEMESDLFIQIGKMAVEEYGAEKFGEAGTTLLEVQQMIAERDEQIQKEDSVCPNCGAPLPESSKFCPECGTKINDEQIQKEDSVCPNCGTPLPDSPKFCPECGTKIN